MLDVLSTLNNSIDDTEWTLVVIPDTQRLAPNNATAYNSLYQWIVDNATAENIKMVMHLGDYANNGASSSEWSVIDTAVTRLHTANIPFVHSAGNHDYDDDGKGTYSRKETEWAAVFPESDWTGEDWYIESYNNITTNMAAKLTIGSRTYLFLTIEIWPRAAVLTWADGVIAANPTDHIIVATHGLTDPDELFQTEDRPSGGGGQAGNPQYYGICNNSTSGDCKTGQEIYDEFLSKHPRIAFAFCGHDVASPNVQAGNGVSQQSAYSKRIDTVSALPINSHLFNYQNISSNAYADSAYLRMYRMKNDGTFSVETYNPVQDTSLTDSENQFSGTF